MKKLLKPIFILLIVALVSCKKETTATLEVLNESSCLQYIYKGSNSSDNLIGTVLQNQKESYEIDLENEKSLSILITSSPTSSCTNQSDVEYIISFEKGKTSSFTID